MPGYTKPAIDRVGESKSDAEIICDLAKELKLGDAELEAGYEKNLDFILKDLDITVEELKGQRCAGPRAECKACCTW